LELLNYNPFPPPPPPVFEVMTDPVCELATYATPPVPELLLVILNSFGVDKSLVFPLEWLSFYRVPLP